MSKLEERLVKRAEDSRKYSYWLWIGAWIAHFVGYLILVLSNNLSSSYEDCRFYVGLLGFLVFLPLHSHLYVVLLNVQYYGDKRRCEGDLLITIFLCVFIIIRDLVIGFAIGKIGGWNWRMLPPPFSLVMTTFGCIILIECIIVSIGYRYNKSYIKKLEGEKEIAKQKAVRVRAENRKRQEAKEARQRRIAAIRAEKPETADEFTARGKRFLDEGLLDEALVNLDAALFINPDHVEANIWKGKAKADQAARTT